MHIFGFLVFENFPFKTQAKEVSMHDVPIIDHSCLSSQFYLTIYCSAARSNDKVQLLFLLGSVAILVSLSTLGLVGKCLVFDHDLRDQLSHQTES